MKMDDEYWRAAREREQASRGPSPIGAINMALLFGTAVIAISLIITPLLSQNSKTPQTAQVPAAYDTMTTGSIPEPSKGAKRYTIRRSVLQETPGAVCIIDINGNSNGC